MYKIIFTKDTARSLQKMPSNVAMLIREKLEAIAGNPYDEHPNAKKLHGRDGYWLRIGDRRALYEINDDILEILVLNVAPRGEVYR